MKLTKNNDVLSSPLNWSLLDLSKNPKPFFSFDVLTSLFLASTLFAIANLWNLILAQHSKIFALSLVSCIVLYAILLVLSVFETPDQSNDFLYSFLFWSLATTLSLNSGLAIFEVCEPTVDFIEADWPWTRIVPAVWWPLTMRITATFLGIHGLCNVYRRLYHRHIALADIKMIRLLQRSSSSSSTLKDYDPLLQQQPSLWLPESQLQYNDSKSSMPSKLFFHTKNISEL